jgi:hypothetical protein
MIIGKDMNSRRRENRRPERDLPVAETTADEVPEWLERVRTAVQQEPPLMRTLMMRAIQAVLEFTSLSEDSAVNATAAPTNLAVLIRALSSGELLEDLQKAEPLAPAFIRGIETKRRLIEEHGGTWTVGQVATNLGITRQAVEKRRRMGKLIAVSTGRHGYRYPVWQFSESGTIPGLEEVLNVLASHDEWMQMAFFLESDPLLDGEAPLSVLRTGRLNQVLNSALTYGEHGAA